MTFGCLEVLRVLGAELCEGGGGRGGGGGGSGEVKQIMTLRLKPRLRY